MAQLPLLTCSDVRLSFGGKPLFTGVTFSVAKGERAALVGRNGAGKSTLMKLVTGVHEPDAGEVWLQPGTTAGWVRQEPDMTGFATVLDFAAEHSDTFRAEAELMGMGLDPALTPETLSGGQARRAALARAFAQDPDLLLLDEPTNHLDVPMIEALEDRLQSFRGAVLVVSHDRRFLEEVSTCVLWLRRGEVMKSPQGYRAFDDWAEAVEAEEAKGLRKLETQLKGENRWLLRGVTGRRKRNQGRLTKLIEMRGEHAALKADRQRSGASLDMTAETTDAKAKRVIEARGLEKTYPLADGGELPIVCGLDMRIVRGDRLAIIGPNGAGKTTLLRLLLGEEAPDAGSVKVAKNLEVTYLDQKRDTLRAKDTLWEAMAPGGGDSIDVQGRSRHVAAYAKDFLFQPDQLRQPVGALSGGERNRLTLALALAKPADVLVLDEPTNDLDMQTLDLLEDMLIRFEGTLILVSHDRAFVDHTVTSCLVPLGRGGWVRVPGGWRDAESQVSGISSGRARVRGPKGGGKAAPKPKSEPTKLTFKDTHRLKEIDKALPRLAAEIKALEAALADPELFTRDNAAFTAKSARLEAARLEVEQAEEDWLQIEERREALEA